MANIYEVLACVHAKSLQSCPALCDPVDWSSSGLSLYGILQARILAWVAMPSSRRSFQPRDWTLVSCVLYWQVSSLPPVAPGKPMKCFSSVQFSYLVVSDSLWPHESQHARPPCPLPTPRVHSDSRPLSQWCHPAMKCLLCTKISKYSRHCAKYLL